MKTQRLLLQRRWPQLVTVVFVCLLALQSAAQLDTNMLPLEQIKQEDLLDMPFEDLMVLVKRYKLKSINELYEKVLNPKVQSASKFEEAYFSAPSNITVLTGKEILYSGALNIPEALRLVPGIIVRQQTNGNYDVHIRGNDIIPGNQFTFSAKDNQTLVMIDGRTVYNHFQGGTFWETLPVSLLDIDRIEVVYGPMAALYGPNAVAGVIHIITKRSQQGWHAAAIAQGGENNSLDMQANASYATKKIEASVAAHHQDLDRFQTDYEVFVPDLKDDTKRAASVGANHLGRFIPDKEKKYPNPSLAVRNTAVNANIRYHLNSKDEVSLYTGMQSSNVQSLFLQSYSTFITGRKSQSAYANLFADIGGFKLNSSYNAGTQDMALGFSGNKFKFGDFQSSIEYIYQWKGLKVSPGFSFQNVTYKYDADATADTNMVQAFDDQQYLSTTAAFVRAEYLWQKRVRLSAALRSEWFYVPHKNYLSYQFTFNYLFSKEANFRLVYSKAHRGPFMWDYHRVYQYTEMLNNGYVTVQHKENPDLDLLSMHMFELGQRFRLAKSLQCDFSFFYNMTKDFNTTVMRMDHTNNDTLFVTSQKENIHMEARQIGAQINIEWLMNKRLRFRTFFSLQQTVTACPSSFYTDEEEECPLSANLYQRFTPALFGGASFYYNWKERLAWSADMYLASNQQMITYKGPTQIDAKLTFNTKIEYRFWQQNSCFVNVRNLFDNTAKEFVFGDRSGRLFLAGVHLKF